MIQWYLARVPKHETAELVAAKLEAALLHVYTLSKHLVYQLYPYIKACKRSDNRFKFFAPLHIQSIKICDQRYTNHCI